MNPSFAVPTQHISIVSIGLVAILGLLALALIRYLEGSRKGQSRQRWPIRLLPVLKLAVVIVSILWIAWIILKTTPVYFFGLSLLLGSILVWSTRFLLMDVASGVFLRSESPFHKGDSLIFEGEHRTIEHVGLRSVTVKTVDGVITKIPYLNLSQSPLSSPAMSGLVRSHSFKLSVSAAAPIQDALDQVKACLLRLPWSLPTHLPTTEIIESSADTYLFQVTVYTLDKRFFPEIEKQLKKEMEGVTN